MTLPATTVAKIFTELCNITPCDVYFNTQITLFVKGERYDISSDGEYSIKEDAQIDHSYTPAYLHGYMGFDKQELRVDELKKSDNTRPGRVEDLLIRLRRGF